MEDIRLPTYERMPGGDHVAEYAGYIGHGPLPADALSDLLRQIAGNNPPTGLTEREKALLRAIEWLADQEHARYHADDLEVSSRADCPVDTCQYGTAILAGAEKAHLPGAS